ncbi:MAG TPA: hypothetical protein VGI70_13885, partial [Polyangiales bacterium]
MNALMSAEQLRLGVPGGVWVAALLFALALAVVVIGLYEQRAIQAPGRRHTLQALRIASASVAFLYVVQPAWVSERVEQLPGRLAILLDASRSMLVRDADDTRLARAVSLLQRLYDNARDKPALFVFGRELTPIARNGLALNEIVPRDDTRIERALNT